MSGDHVQQVLAGLNGDMVEGEVDHSVQGCMHSFRILISPYY